MITSRGPARGVPVAQASPEPEQARFRAGSLCPATGWKPVPRWVAVCAAGILFAGTQARALTLVTDGRADAAIVVPEQCDYYTVQIAADHLKEYVRKATGAELAVVTDNAVPAGTLISVGRTRLAAAAGLKTDDFELDGCRLLVKDNVLFLIGRDTPGPKPWRRARGTCRAVYTFLEDFLGVRWLIPAPEGELVPLTKDLAIPDTLDRTVTSTCAFVRSGPYPYTSPGYVANSSYEKVNLWHRGGESWMDFVPVAKYFEEHPEYFALVNGKRTNHALNFLCVSNPDVRQLMLREVRRLFDEGYDWIQLAQSDGFQMGLCECPGCMALDDFRGDTNWEALLETPCERVLGLHRWIAEECKKSHPGKTIQMILYSVSTAPPRTFEKFPDNVVGEVAAGTFERFKEVCEAWRGKVRGFNAYLYWDDATVEPLGMLLETTPSVVAEQMKYMHEQGVNGLYIAGGMPKYWGLEGPMYYTIGRLIDHPERSPDELVQEYCQGIYGESSAPMIRFFDMYYSRIDATGADGPTDMRDLFVYRFPPRVVRQLDRLLAAAEYEATTERTGHWLQLTRDFFDYIKTMSNTIVAYKAYRANATMPNLLELKDRVAEFEAYRARIVSYAGDSEYVASWFPRYQYLYRFLLGKGVSDPCKIVPRDATGMVTAGSFIGAPITWNFDKMLANFGADTQEKSMVVARTSTPPVIDGTIGAAEWEQATSHTVGESTGGEAKVPTSVRALYDEANLYVAFLCHEPDIAAIKAGDTTRDGAVWRMDCVELLLDPEISFKKYLHFMAAPADAYYDARTSPLTDRLDPMYGKEDPGWNPEWRYGFHVDKDEKVWSIEMVFTFKGLETEAPEPGTRWRGNFGRERYAGEGGDFSLWSPNEDGSFCDASTFGELVFGGETQMPAPPPPVR